MLLLTFLLIALLFELDFFLFQLDASHDYFFDFSHVVDEQWVHSFIPLRHFHSHQSQRLKEEFAPFYRVVLNMCDSLI